MKLSNYKKANDREVREWLKENLELSPYQEDKLRYMNFPRDSPYDIVEYIGKSPASSWWRLTLPLYPVYYVLAFVFICIRWIVSGKWGIGRKFLDKFHYPWTRKLGL